MPSNKSFRTKVKLAKAARQNRPVPQWIRLRYLSSTSLGPNYKDKCWLLERATQSSNALTGWEGKLIVGGMQNVVTGGRRNWTSKWIAFYGGGERGVGKRADSMGRKKCNQWHFCGNRWILQLLFGSEIEFRVRLCSMGSVSSWPISFHSPLCSHIFP